jgi:hypothetical protein
MDALAPAEADGGRSVDDGGSWHGPAASGDDCSVLPRHCWGPGQVRTAMANFVGDRAVGAYSFEARRNAGHSFPLLRGADCPAPFDARTGRKP